MWKENFHTNPVKMWDTREKRADNTRGKYPWQDGKPYPKPCPKPVQKISPPINPDPEKTPLWNQPSWSLQKTETAEKDNFHAPQTPTIRPPFRATRPACAAFRENPRNGKNRKHGVNMGVCFVLKNNTQWKSFDSKLAVFPL